MSPRTFQITGWLLFVLSALGFIVSSIRSGDVLSLIAGVLFLVGCVMFLVPLVQRSS